MNILIWHVHGSWTTAFVQGEHRYLIPVDSSRSADGLGRAQTYAWPSSTLDIGQQSRLWTRSAELVELEGGF